MWASKNQSGSGMCVPAGLKLRIFLLGEIQIVVNVIRSTELYLINSPFLQKALRSTHEYFLFWVMKSLPMARP